MTIYDDEHVERAYPNTTGRRAEDNARAARGEHPIPKDLASGRSWQEDAPEPEPVKPTYSDSRGVQALEEKVYGHNPSCNTALGNLTNNPAASKSDIRKYNQERRIGTKSKRGEDHTFGSGWYSGS